jgi:sugar transferase (PEP-CTERM/EpsH1 system associated)
LKILYLTSRFPYPLEKGDKLRAYNQVKELSKDHQVILYSITENRVIEKWEDEIRKVTYFYHYSYLSTFQKYLNLFRGLFNDLPFQINYFYNERRKKNIEKLIVRFNPDAVFCQLIRMSEFARHTGKPKVLDYMDAFSKGIERRMEEQPFYLKEVYALEYRRLLKYEASVHRDFDASIIISNADKEMIPLENRETIETVRNGVNFEYFRPRPDTIKEFDLVFTGNMSYPPNVSAVLFLHNEILPLLKARNPEIKVLIAGANPVSKVKELHTENFVVTGWVEEINEYYAKSKIFIAPMLTGTGLQNKLLEAMAMQLPCITSPLVNQSLGAADGKEILIADSPAEYANCVNQLLEQEKFANEIALAGFSFVTLNFSWGKTIAQLNRIFERITSQGGS